MTYQELLAMLKAAGSGFVGGTMGAPMDTAVAATNLSRAAYGYGGHKLGLLSAGQMPEPIDPKGVPGTSAHLSGLLGVGDSKGEAIAEFVGGLLSPGPKTAKQPNRSNWTAYHGSPHKFDKFDLSKIGTGEGAQAYGHGLYFADNPEVAQEYARALGEQVTIKGKHAYDARSGSMAGDAPIGGAAMSMLRGVNWDVERAKKLALNNWLEGQDPYFKRAADELEGLSQKDVNRTFGQMYKVDIDDTRAPKDAFLDWDKPLSQQSERVKKIPAIAKLIEEDKAYLARYPSGGVGERTGANVITTVPESVLKAQGLPGIRYLDAGSRGSGGTHNTVLFDDALVKILERR